MSTDIKKPASGKESRFFIELASDCNLTYYQIVRRADRAIIFANRSLARIAERIYHPVYEDGSRVIL